MKRLSLGYNKKSILITGAGGFIGRELCRRLSGKYNVFGLDLKQKGRTIKDLKAVDMRNRKEVERFLAEFKIEIYAVIHLSSRLASADEIEDISIFYDNIRIAENAALIVKRLKPGKMINFSSMAVYPNADGKYSETSEIKPSSNSDCLYGLSKFCSENILDFILRDEGISISHLRISQVYGNGMRKDRIIPAMLKELKEKNTITVFGNGERISNFIHIDKIVDFVDMFLRRSLNGAFNIGSEQISYKKLAEKLIKERGRESSKVIQKNKGSKAKFYLDTGKINKLI